jgi:hypothetical protein
MATGRFMAVPGEKSMEGEVVHLWRLCASADCPVGACDSEPDIAGLAAALRTHQSPVRRDQGQGVTGQTRLLLGPSWCCTRSVVAVLQVDILTLGAEPPKWRPLLFPCRPDLASLLSNQLTEPRGDA